MIVVITRKFIVGTSFNNAEFVKTKLEEFGANIWHARQYDTKFGPYEIHQVHFECSASEEKLDQIIEHFRLNYNGVISFTF